MKTELFGETDGVRARVGEQPLRPAAMRRFGRTMAKYYGENATVWIGRDTRESGVWMEDEIVKGGKEAGLSFYEAGILPTPALSKIVGESGNQGGIMLTASHNPASDNGIKLFRADGEKLSKAEELAFEKIYFGEAEDADRELPQVKIDGVRAEQGALALYVESLQKYFGDLRLDGKLLYDSASGAGHDFDMKVLAAFGLQVERLSPEPNGRNINDGYGALHPEKLSEAARAQGCWGVAMDGDADRALLADETGRIWNGDRIISLLAMDLQAKGQLPKNGVVLTEYSNLATVQFLTKQGIRVEKVVNGDRLVAQKCDELGFVLGGEMSGHVIYTPWLSSSDGCFVALMVARLLHERQCRLADLWPDYVDMPSKQWAIQVREKRPLAEMPAWAAQLAAIEQELQGHGRVFCRYSGTENKLRIMVEADDAAMVERSGEALAEIIKKEVGA